MSTYSESVRDDLRTLGALGGEALEEAALRLGAALDAPLRSRLLEVIGQLVAELGSEGVELDVRVAGDDVRMIAREAPPNPVEPPGDLSARVALRLPEGVKRDLDARAAAEGLSANAWIVRALQGALARPEAPAVRGRRRMSGTGIS